MMKNGSKEQTAEVAKPAARKASILIVESDPDLLSLLAGTFRLQNFVVYTASSAMEASEVYPTISHSVNVVLLNGNTVGIEGIDAILAIRRLNPDQKIIAIAGEENTQVNAMKVQGLFVVIVRPLTVDSIVQAVLELMREKRRWFN